MNQDESPNMCAREKTISEILTNKIRNMEVDLLNLKQLRESLPNKMNEGAERALRKLICE